MPMQALGIQDAHNSMSRERFHELAGSRSSSGTRHKALVYSNTANPMREDVKPAALRMVAHAAGLYGAYSKSSGATRALA
jgi:hypothetical protein